MSGLHLISSFSGFILALRSCELREALELVSVAQARCRDFVSRPSGLNVIPTQ